ncbi:MAG: hypothetical protein JO253_06900 [Alphaproteobacteria bacterium]|nr:hypothetical protein [Alphaproteobacteria bacterium]
MADKEPEMGWTFVLLFLVLGLALILFWYYFRGPILETLRWVRLGELWMIHPFTNVLDPCINWVRFAQINDTSPSMDMVHYTYQCFGADTLATLTGPDRADYFALSAQPMSDLESRISVYLKWPLIAAFVAVGVHASYFSIKNKFRQRHNLESFIKVQAKMWPVINPIVDFNPIKSSARLYGSKVPDKLPLFAEALSPEEWISFHRIPVSNGVVDREATRRALVAQLGPRWNGIKGQPDYIRALLAAFALKGVQKRDQCEELLGKIALCWSAKGGMQLTPAIMTEVNKILRDPNIGGKAEELGANFAYRASAVLGILRWGRMQGGVIAPAAFLWMRGVDRPLWYAMNNLGRRSFHAEGAGALAHFMAEQAAGNALPIPRVDTAIVTFNQYLAETGRPIPPREGDDDHRKGA